MYKKVLHVFTFLFITISCATNKNLDINSAKSELNTNIDNNLEIQDIKIDLEAQSNKEFGAILENINISVKSSPKEVVKGNDFNTGYTVFVCDSQNMPVSNFNLQIKYPSKKENETLIYDVLQASTDENGEFTFKAPKSTFAAKDKITFLPLPLLDNDYQNALAEKKAATADYKVKSDFTTKGVVLFVYDYNEKNLPSNNSYELLSALRATGLYMVGNAPISDVSYIGKSAEQLYKANYEYIEDSYGYLIYGTIKFEQPVTASDDGFTCILTAEISAIEMKHGKVVLTHNFSQTGTGANWNKCVSKAKTDLAKNIVNYLIYGL